MRNFPPRGKTVGQSNRRESLPDFQSALDGDFTLVVRTAFSPAIRSAIFTPQLAKLPAQPETRGLLHSAYT